MVGGAARCVTGNYGKGLTMFDRWIDSTDDWVAASDVIYPNGHMPVTHLFCVTTDCDICLGTIFFCARCRGLGGYLPSMCPGRVLTWDEVRKIATRALDYRMGGWIMLPSVHARRRG